MPVRAIADNRFIFFSKSSHPLFGILRRVGSSVTDYVKDFESPLYEKRRNPCKFPSSICHSTSLLFVRSLTGIGLEHRAAAIGYGCPHLVMRFLLVDTKFSGIFGIIPLNFDLYKKFPYK